MINKEIDEKEKSYFVDIFGNYPKIRVMDFLLENYIFDYSKTQLSEFTDVSMQTLGPIIDDLLESKIIKCSRKVGNSQMYRLNRKNELSRLLLKLDKRIILLSLKKNGGEDM